MINTGFDVTFVRISIQITGSSAIRFHDCGHTATTFMLSHGILPVETQYCYVLLGRSTSILSTPNAHFIQTMQDQAAQVLQDVLTPIPIELHSNS